MLDGDGKAAVIRAYGARYGCRVLVETGTYHGDTVAACSANFKRVFSIELGKELAEEARTRFRQYGHIHILQGDSGVLLPAVLAVVYEPTLFWLDAHFSGSDTVCGEGITPIVNEMSAILSVPHENHVILIDDARDFTPEKGHPPLGLFLDKVNEHFPNHRTAVEDDIIRITPKRDL